ncbi:4-aminobutyrate aminotransferase [Robbsia andropogonis]|uniref:4-aminobutyrate aminotransferase n=1 Tax=Robbsia andropogonis TaxID=28092 RepID=A0A0F5K1F2_9BURK|nr:4-aminobutyrate--2-oxoglutarate transaminase [Robbsia andropogonis]KKB63694.1 4-aminobutyrate aminotransferase [Robbsia andropogonis]MCP1119291.1 4-aminobutyrate--2-oxoglutarate transaminase [Robbsia andropogonis]MCP1129131.1 4-aminobutyrate--2-oxoglutarate transaminase [Robbsia andropogonis]
MTRDNAAFNTFRQQHVPRGVVTAHPIFADKAAGAELWDVEGRRYIDFVGGIGVQNIGHSHPKVIAAVHEQLKRVTHAAFQVVGYDGYVTLAAKLNKMIGGDTPYKTFFATTGVEAVENAVKIARAYRNVPGIIAFRGGFHGRTLLGSTLTGMSSPYKQNFGPLAGDVYHTPYPDDYRGFSAADAIRALEDLFATQIMPDRVAAIIIEPVQGDGGFLPAGKEFMHALRDLTRKHGIVLILDEIQSGFGRTGEMFGFQHFGIQPDLVTVAKSLAGGLPLSGVVGRAEIMDAPLPGGLGGTYAGNPLACAAALAVLDVFEAEKLLEQGRALGEQLRAGLQRIAAASPEVGIVRGVGPMAALEFVKDADPFQPDAHFAQAVIDRCREEGLLVIKCGVHRNTLRLLAPLNTPKSVAEEALAILDSAIAHCRAA